MSDHDPAISASQAVGLADENALLRAALSDAQRQIEELQRLADADTLTPLPNLRRFERELERVVGQAERHGTSAAVLTIDLKGLKAVNERHGRLAGDAALLHVARLVSGLIRSTDLLARIGGDRFGLILDHLDQNSAIETAERIGRCIASTPVDLGHAQVGVEATIAVTGILAGDSAAEVIDRADRNLARLKSGF